VEREEGSLILQSYVLLFGKNEHSDLCSRKAKKGGKKNIRSGKKGTEMKNHGR
jgi:hypothetical protein